MSTGVRILPRDTTGYLFDGMFVTYQGCRQLQEQYARLYPELRAGIAEQARQINAQHLRRLLAKETAHFQDRHWHANMPRALRRAWERSGILDGKRSVVASDEYVLSMDKIARKIKPGTFFNER